MSSDLALRVVSVVDLLLVLPLMIHHRLKAHTNEKLDRRQEGVFILATLRPVGLIFFAGAAIYLVNPARMAWSSVRTTDNSAASSSSRSSRARASLRSVGVSRRPSATSHLRSTGTSGLRHVQAWGLRRIVGSGERPSPENDS